MTMPKLKRIYITAPRLGLSGGVATFVSTLKGRLADEEVYLYRGGGKKPFKSVSFFADIINALFKVSFGGDGPVLVNTSMNNSAWKRDRILIYLLVLTGKKVSVFVHGWNDADAKIIMRNPVNIAVLNKCYNIFTLQENFSCDMRSANVTSKITKAHTVVDQKFINYFSEKNKILAKRPVILFLARLEEDKGVVLFLEAISEIAPDRFEYIICGDGSKARHVEELVTSLKIDGYDISYEGRVEGSAKELIFEKSHFYIFPTKHGEGMPISVLEAMVAGLVPLVSRQQALEAIIEEGSSGFFIEDLSPKSIAKRLIELCENEENFSRVSALNMKKAPRIYSPNNLATRIVQEVSQND